MMEARIADIEVMLKRVKVIDEDELSNEHIHIGSKVELRVTNKQTGKSDVMMYQIVGSNEADPLEGLISDESAVAARCSATARAIASTWRFPSA